VIHLVGELNPYGEDPRFALYDEPIGASGHRLREYILGIPRRVYLADSLFTRQNLCVGHWHRETARARMEILIDSLTSGDLVVTLGRRVAQARQSQYVPTPRPWEVQKVVSRGSLLLALPHPSGLCREWNDPAAARRARDILRSVAPHVRWGELNGE